ncbi:ergothioneine biosynthesis protein EgtB [Sphingomonas sp. SUN039]|uniref:ergothioneine biosynthesis protein EgtB n=1 Tax=Sphingomonas sp. SUN039 TaxID=2937787 RepID=UPI00216424C6|nr:ergothioneine biosynthesis protein EgtB [Sphingomonas sp. SUN039]UVO55113.1 ergothioneine biosynthesis protein EgtB [Sphingomonas sp. SUN039]
MSRRQEQGVISQQSTATASDLLRDLFVATRTESVARAAPLSDAEATIQSMPDASPAKWHLAHTSWFLETFVLRDFVKGYAPFDPAYAYLFNSYYDAEGDRHARPRRGMLARPALDEILAYRAHVDTAVIAAWPTLPPVARNLIELGCHHEAQHQELLLTDILHAFAQNPLEPALWTLPPARRPSAAVAAPGWVAGPTGIVGIGHGGQGFVFDCEGPRHKVWLNPHAVADRLVTNAEWQAFIDGGGYRRSELWLSDGWAWVQAEEIAAPLYWHGGTAFGLHGRQPRDPAACVRHIGFYEADAYARWAEARLPTEFEWEASAAALPDAFGEVWQWTASAYLPYPGFRIAEGAVGEYNGKFMSGQMVLRGSSFATPDGTSRITTRNFFPPTARWQFSGLRLAKDL